MVGDGGGKRTQTRAHGAQAWVMVDTPCLCVNERRKNRFRIPLGVECIFKR